jgi:hypothetical protein
LHRQVQKQPWYEPFKPRWYLHFDFSIFSKPNYASGQTNRDGMATYLYATTFGDFWNYLNPNAKVEARNDEISPTRKRGLQGLLILAIPIALGGLALVFRKGWQFVGGRFRNRSVGFSTATALVGISLFWAQFLAYIHRYREVVATHAGYLWPCLILFCWLVGDALDKMQPWRAQAVCVYLLVFSGISAYVFWF